MDDETHNWPIKEKYKDVLHLISPSHKAVPLHTYNGDTFIEPNNINSTLQNALIKVHFSLHHTLLTKQSPPHNIF
ncbi:hypothetical protein J3R82DRAFT_8847 [Butyriboletus roseoflavus]|nr:hypothetical protein J3R82DRAFT_8847 [Butyriboletus roseoflavus]